jgi:hypothetical protein
MFLLTEDMGTEPTQFGAARNEMLSRPATLADRSVRPETAGIHRTI